MARFGERVWKVSLFSGPRLERYDAIGLPAVASDQPQARFRSSRVIALLAYLAIHLDKYCTREQIIDALWPGETDLAVLKNRLRVTLSSLRQHLEPDGVPFDSVLDTSMNGCLRLRASAVWCDLEEFEKAYQSGNMLAAGLMNGPILPTLQDEWILDLKTRIDLIAFDLEAPSRSEKTVDGQAAAANQNHSLPHFFTTFVPADGLKETLTELLKDNRLITIVGTGGIGKTRLSIEVCRASDTPTIFVPLAESADTDAAFETILRHLGVGSQTRLNSKQQIEAVFKSLDPVRLILDNIEHLLETDSDWVQFLLSLNQNVSILCTSRRTVNIPGECVYQLEPMTRPQPGGKLAEYPATRLFIDRVKQSRPDYRFAQKHDEDIIAICNLVEGLPLGIELASAQISTRSIAEIRQIVETNLLALRSKHRGISQRHRSLQAVAESSFDRQSAEHIAFLGRLSVFRGSFTLDQATQVCADLEAEDKISELVQNSLLASLLEGDQMRFKLLGFVRRLAFQRLSEADQQDAALSHSQYFLGLAAQVQEGDLRTVEPLDPEEANLQHALTTADTAQAGFWRACRGALARSFIRGQHRTGLELVQRFFPRIDDCHDSQAQRAWLVAALHVVPDVGTKEEIQQVLGTLQDLAMREDDPIARAYSMVFRGDMMGAVGDLQARVRLQRDALELAKTTGDVELVEVAMCHLSGSLHTLGIESPPGEKTPHLQEAEQLAAALVPTVGIYSRRHALSRLLLAVALFYQGRHLEAEGWFQQARSSAEQLQVVTVLMYCAFFERELALLRQDQDAADQLAADYVRLRRQIGITLPANFLFESV